MMVHKILVAALEAKPFRHSVLRWAKQVRPPLSDRKLWKKCLSRLCLQDRELIIALGKWVNPSHQMWEFMTDQQEAYLLKTVGELQKQFPRLRRGIYIKPGRIRVEPLAGFPI